MRRRAAWIAIAALLSTTALEVVSLSPAAQSVLGIPQGQGISSFDFYGVHLRITGGYANSAWTVLNFSGMPPKQIPGAVSLQDQFGLQYPGEEANNNDKGSLAVGFRPASLVTAVAGLRFTLTFSVFDPDTELYPHNLPMASGTILFDRGTDLLTAAPGRIGAGEVTFRSVRYGGRALYVAFAVKGIDVIGGFDGGEVSRPAGPGLDVTLVPGAGGPAQHMWMRHQVSGDVTSIQAMATLVDPGPYSLVLSLKGVGILERTLMVP